MDNFQSQIQNKKPYTTNEFQYFAYLYWTIFGNIDVMGSKGATPRNIEYILHWSDFIDMITLTVYSSLTVLTYTAGRVCLVSGMKLNQWHLSK